MWVKMIISIGLFISYLASAEGGLFVYWRNYDAYDHRNWLDHFPQKECTGLVFDSFYGVTSIRKLEVQQLVFGKSGTFMMNEDTEILFDVNSKSIMNCIALNGSEMAAHSWTDPDNWVIHDQKTNMAVPHMERLPCEHDDVIFPKGILSGQVMVMQKVNIKSLKFGTEYWTNHDLEELKNHLYLKDTIVVLRNAGLNIRHESCLDLSGCACGNELANSDVCYRIDEPVSLDCLNPIFPIGFCTHICGASIVFKPKDSFKIFKIEEKLKQYSSDSHVSKVKNEDGEYVIQIIFTDKEFSGDSIEEAKKLYQILEDGQFFDTKESQFLLSTHRSEGGQEIKNAVSIIFGSLLGACVVFGLLFLLFGEEERTKNFRERLGLGSRPLTYRSIFFSRNSSVSEGTGLIIERQSVAGSLQNIPKSFENPMFSEIKKQKASSTASSSASSTQDITKVEKEENREGDNNAEELMFDEQERRELIETVAEEGELVDLSEMK